ncbi:hypothetical protein [Vitiosangium sp. GDMCC 1.1324]|uniref:hypothetical protein n=1 Tax=Vitiosangium sp. (strain GDMCC 1.1324) TaxID=2138576 RepID=UPI0011B6324B|nr:hypothetical protein [Vitiosangium sp. GDMCC 1.1324]
MYRFLVALSFLLCACGEHDSNDNAPPTTTTATTLKSLFELQPADFKERRTLQVNGTAGQGLGSGVSVHAGEVLLITASGTLQTPWGQVGPDGSPALGGTSFQLINRRVFALYGRIHGNVFPVNYETALIAPDTGPLELLVNGCEDCANSGNFTVDVYSQPVEGVALAETPSVTDNTVTRSSTVQVTATTGWALSGIQVRKGQKLFVQATGTVEANGETLTADGAEGWLAGEPYLVVNATPHRLYGRVGGNVFELGTNAALLAPATGELELVINHANEATGGFDVTVGLGVVPARGLIGADTADFARATAELRPAMEWTPTSLVLKKGDPLLVRATGQLTGDDPDLFDKPLDAFGSSALGGTSFLPSRFLFALYGRVGGQVVLLGAQNALLAPADGTLELAVNGFSDCTSACDVQGAFSVEVRGPSHPQ